MKIIEEFKAFAIKGNALDMAVGIIIGAAFGTVVKSLVDDVIMPPIGKILGGVDFSNLYINLSGGKFDTLEAAQTAGSVTINYGLFFNNIISFLIVAWAVFLLIKGMSRMKKNEPPTGPTEKECPYCKSNIPAQATKCAHCTSEV